MPDLKSENLKGKILVTSNVNPDVDGVACIIAYSELLKKQGIDVIPGVIGDFGLETRFVLEKFNISCPEFDQKLVGSFDKFILVDDSKRDNLPKGIEIKKIIEVIDHRKYNESHVFSNAKIQIELVGAAATLIVEKFIEHGTRPSESSCILLYAGIISNTLNFKSNTTTERDVRAANWLRKMINLPENFAREMFIAKSDFRGKNLKKILMQDYKVVDKDEKFKFSIFQLEVVDLEEIIEKNKKEIIDFLKEDKEKQNFNCIFLTGVDLEKGYNIFVVADDETKNILKKALKVNFIGNTARREGLLLRKEIIPIIKESVESES